MFYYQSSIWEDIFFPNHNNKLKKIIFLSAITGVASAAITNYFSKKENRTQTKRNFDRLFEEISVVKDRVTDKARDVATDFNNNIKKKGRQAGESYSDANAKYDNSNSE
jgi:hypothetical protein